MSAILSATDQSGSRAFFAWVSRLDLRRGSICTVESSEDVFAKLDYFDVHLSPGRWLVSIMTPYKAASKPTHLGSLLLDIKASKGAKSTSSIAPLAYAPPRRRNDNYANCVELDPKLTITATCNECAIQQIDLRGSDPKDYDQPEEFFGIIAESPDKHQMLGFSRDVMLFYPTLRVPGWGGIPQTVVVGEDCAQRLLKKVGGTGQGQESLQLLAGVYTTDQRMRYATEFIDDVSPMQATFFRGDDCDGSSVSAYNLLLSLAAVKDGLGRPKYDDFVGTPMLVSGYARLSKGRYNNAAKETVGHAWVMLRNFETGALTMCETTACTTDDSHFLKAAFAWTTSACYAFCTMKGTKLYIGVEMQKLSRPWSLPIKSDLPKSETGPFLYRVDVPLRDNLFQNTHWFKDAPTNGALSAYVCGTYHDHGGTCPTAASALDKSILRRS